MFMKEILLFSINISVDMLVAVIKIKSSSLTLLPKD